MIAFGWVTNMLQRGLASWQRMLEVLDAAPAITDAAARPALGGPADPRAASRCAASSFAYGDGRPVLDGRVVPGGAGPDRGARRADRLGEVHAALAAPAPLRSAARHGVRRRHRRARVAARDAARRDRVRAAGGLPVLGPRGGEHRLRRRRRGRRRRRRPGARPPRGGHRPAGQGPGGVPGRLRHAGRRARHHALGRPEAADGARPRPDDRPAHPDPRRRAVGGGHLHGGGDPGAPARVHARADLPHRLAPRLDRSGRRPDPGARRAAGSWSAARTTSSWRRAACTPTSTGSSSWKRSWPNPDGPTRRRGARQGVRRAADAAAARAICFPTAPPSRCRSRRSSSSRCCSSPSPT